MDFEQPVGDVNSVIRVDADQVGVEGHVVDLVSRRPCEITGCSRRSSASIKMRATSTSRGSDKWEVAYRPR
jgi:hypothetical protein